MVFGVRGTSSRKWNVLVRIFVGRVLCWLGDVKKIFLLNERVFKGGTVELPSTSIFNDKVLL